ncbi:MAG: universal stress protein [Sulfolobaceae archaeon]
MLNKFLVAYDDSEKSKKALELAIEIAKYTNAKIIILTVANTCIETMGMPLNEYLDKIKKACNEKISNAIEIMKSKNFNNFETVILEGEPVTTIVEYAKKENVDIIFVGSRGLSRLKKVFMGSVSQGILELANIPVVVVK